MLLAFLALVNNQFFRPNRSSDATSAAAADTSNARAAHCACFGRSTVDDAGAVPALVIDTDFPRGVASSFFGVSVTGAVYVPEPGTVDERPSRRSGWLTLGTT